MCLFCQVTSLKMLTRSVGSMSLDHGMVLLCEQKSWYLKILVHCVVVENIHTHPRSVAGDFKGMGSQSQNEWTKTGIFKRFGRGVCLPKKPQLEVYGHFLEQFTDFVVLTLNYLNKLACICHWYLSCFFFFFLTRFIWWFWFCICLISS